MEIQPVELTITCRSGLRLVQLVEIHDSLQGQSYRGRSTGMAHSVDGSAVTIRLDSQRLAGV